MSICYYGCGKEAKFFFKNGKGCCVKHYAGCPALVARSKTKERETLITRYGTTNRNVTTKLEMSVTKSKAVRKTQIKQANFLVPEGQLCEYGCNQAAKFILFQAKTDLEKFCCSHHHLACPKGRWTSNPEKIAKYQEKTGLRNSLQDVEKIRNTRKQKYGVIHHMKVPEIKAKKAQTCITLYGAPQGLTEEQHQANVRAKYGVDNVFQLPEVIEKLKATNRNKFGTDYPAQSSSWFNSFKTDSLYKRKSFILPSGKIIKLQGYEPQALTLLLQNFTEDNFQFSDKPVFHYTNKGKQRVYHPDLFLPKFGLFIEVKSEYFLKRDLEINLLKARAVQEAGFEFLFMVSKDSIYFNFIPFRFLGPL